MIWDYGVPRHVARNVSVMDVPSATAQSDSEVPSSALRYDVIKSRVADLLGVPVRQVTQQDMADFLGLSRKSIGRFKRGQGAALPTAIKISAVLDMPIEGFTPKASS